MANCRGETALSASSSRCTTSPYHGAKVINLYVSLLRERLGLGFPS